VKTYWVTFTANLLVNVEAEDEDAARDKATEIANIRAAYEEKLSFEQDWVAIHTDDIVSVTEAEE